MRTKMKWLYICLTAVIMIGCQVQETPYYPNSTSPLLTTSPSAKTEVPVPRIDKDGRTLSLVVTDVWESGCFFEICNNGERNAFVFLLDYELERLDSGLWVACSLLRCPEGKSLWQRDIQAGESEQFAWDWSFPYGTLPPGRYRLKAHGFLDQQMGWKAAGEFELTGTETAVKSLPAPAPAVNWVKATMSQASNHKWLLCMTIESEHRIRWEEDYSLFRKEGIDYVPVQASYRLPWGLGIIPNGGKWEQNINLAAAYGELSTGEYLLRKRLIDLTMWPEERASDWDLISQEKLILVDTPFTLEESVCDLDRETDHWDRLLYTSSSPIEDNIVLYCQNASPAKVQITMKNIGEENLTIGYHWFLYFMEREEWFPVPLLTRFGWSMLGMTLQPGEEKMQELNFVQEYGHLPPGNYRLVQATKDERVVFCDFLIPNS